MTERPQWTRRAVLRWLGWLGFMGTVPTVGGHARTTAGRPRAETAIPLEDCFEHIESAAILGREYLRLVPSENDERRLTQLVLADWPGQPEGSGGLEGMRDYLTARRRLDYELGRTVRLDGWVLSQTEARLFGLAALRG